MDSLSQTSLVSLCHLSKFLITAACVQGFLQFAKNKSWGMFISEGRSKRGDKFSQLAGASIQESEKGQGECS